MYSQGVDVVWKVVLFICYVCIRISKKF